jgi:hypothetical protein
VHVTRLEANRSYTPVEVVDVQWTHGGLKLLCSWPWTHLVYRPTGHRREVDFERTDYLVLDFDNKPEQPQLTLDEAIARFADHECVIGTTKSHGVGGHRYRVILRLTETITTVAEYRATIAELLRVNPEADQSCRDAARAWNAFKDIVHVRTGGVRVVPVAVTAPVQRPSTCPLPVPVTGLVMTEAAKRMGSTRPSVSGEGGHNRLFRAACILLHDFCLGDEDALYLLEHVFNPRCTDQGGEPYPWSTRELRHKVASARQAERNIIGYGISIARDPRWDINPTLKAAVTDLDTRLPRLHSTEDAVTMATELLLEMGLDARPRAAKALHGKVLLCRQPHATDGHVFSDMTWLRDLTAWTEACPLDAVTAAMLLGECLDVADTQGNRVRLGKAMHQLGWTKTRTGFTRPAPNVPVAEAIIVIDATADTHEIGSPDEHACTNAFPKTAFEYRRLLERARNATRGRPDGRHGTRRALHGRPPPGVAAVAGYTSWG